MAETEARVPTRAELEAQIDGLWAKQTEATQKRDLKALSAVAAEIRKVQAAIDNITADAEKASIEDALVIARTALLKMDMSAKGEIMSSVEVGGTLRKSETGWDDMVLFVRGDGDPASKAFHDLFPYEVLEGLTTLTGIKFSITKDKVGATEVNVEPTGKAAKSPSAPRTSNGNGGAKGWVKGGVQYTLDQAYQAGASAEDRTAMETAEAAGDKKNAVYSLKVKIAKREGYTKNE